MSAFHPDYIGQEHRFEKGLRDFPIMYKIQGLADLNCFPLEDEDYWFEKFDRKTLKYFIQDYISTAETTLNIQLGRFMRLDEETAFAAYIKEMKELLGKISSRNARIYNESCWEYILNRLFNLVKMWSSMCDKYWEEQFPDWYND